MPKITKYKIVWNSDVKSVEDEVQMLINEGWQPYGPPFSRHLANCIAYVCQAMVQYHPLANV